MGLNYSDDDLDGGEASNVVNEGSPEKAKDKASKSLKKIAQIKKDEQKAKRDDLFLAQILVEFIKDKKYNSIIGHIFPLIDIGTPSNLIIGIISLIYKPASDIIRKNFPVGELIEFDYEINFQKQEFNEEKIDPKVRKRINEWIDDIYNIIILDPSNLLAKRTLKIIASSYKKNLSEFIARAFIFFLHSLNFDISERKALNYADFIVDEIKKKTEKLELEEI
ncbi:MAG: hypothetical protein PHF46_00655 [Candidatus Gracilibacteria bacterium]|nr:hypothetical protein [Candidatus Gracilibacteria bacterium]MDD3119906.1 hypothetical protein [Candidatus Gracilibacteria bacterium]